jgi:formate hydrogenlyase transcriptional activator
VFPIEIPPLRDRPGDISLLAWHFAEKYAQRMNKRIKIIPDEDMEALLRYQWPGNIRELQNIIERAVVLSRDEVLRPSPLPDIANAGKQPSSEVRTLGHAERDYILEALRSTDWVVGGPEGAAARLGVRRTTLLYKMRRLAITRPPK